MLDGGQQTRRYRLAWVPAAKLVVVAAALSAAAWLVIYLSVRGAALGLGWSR